MSLLHVATVYADFRFPSTCGYRTVTAICFKYLTWSRFADLSNFRKDVTVRTIYEKGREQIFFLVELNLYQLLYCRAWKTLLKPQDNCSCDVNVFFCGLYCSPFRSGAPIFFRPSRHKDAFSVGKPPPTTTL